MFSMRRRLPSAAGTLLVLAVMAISFLVPASASASTSQAAAAAASCSKSIYANAPSTPSSSKHQTHASGGVSNSCKGWTKYCVYLVHEFLAGVPYPTPVHSYDAEKCASLKTGIISGSSTKSVTCHAGYYITEVIVYKDGKPYTRKTSAKYDFTSRCLQP